MILAEIRDYVAARHKVPVAALARHFEIDEPALRGMLDVLARKRRLRLCTLEADCGSCRGCALHRVEFCEWLG